MKVPTKDRCFTVENQDPRWGFTNTLNPYINNNRVYTGKFEYNSRTSIDYPTVFKD